MSRPLGRLATAALAVGVVLITAVTPVLAADPAPMLGLRVLDVPGTYFDLTLRPGENRPLRIELGNYGSAPVTARTYAADVYSMVNGGMGVRLAQDTRSGTTLWLAYPAETIALQGRQATTRSFTVSVPADARPGDYMAAIVIEGEAPISQAGDIGFKQVDRQAVAVAITVPGARTPALTVPSATLRTSPAGATFIDFAVENTGNTRLRPEGTFVLQDGAGHELARTQVRMDSLYAGTATTLAMPLSVALAPGHYVASLTLRDPASGIQASSGAQPLEVSAPVAPVPSSGTNLAPAPGTVLIVTDGVGLSGIALVAGLALAAAIAAMAMLSILGRGRRRPVRP